MISYLLFFSKNRSFASYVDQRDTEHMCGENFFFLGSVVSSSKSDEIVNAFASYEVIFSNFEGMYSRNFFFWKEPVLVKYSDELSLFWGLYGPIRSKIDGRRQSAVVLVNMVFFLGSRSPIFLFEPPIGCGLSIEPYSSERDVRAFRKCFRLHSTGWLVSSETDESPPSGGAGGDNKVRRNR